MGGCMGFTWLRCVVVNFSVRPKGNLGGIPKYRSSLAREIDDDNSRTSHAVRLNVLARNCLW
jgi:hypothetical protein